MMQHAFRRSENPRMGDRCDCGHTRAAHASQVGGRDPSFERDYIDLARRRAGINESWATDVHDRMTRMEREKGTESYLQFSLKHMVAEADCEGLDLGGWSMLGALLANRDCADEADRQIIQELFCQIAQKGAEVRAIVDQLRSVLD